MTDFQALLLVLEASVARNGEKPLTNAYLLNLVKMAKRLKLRAEEAKERQLDQIYAEVIGEDRMWGSD